MNRLILVVLILTVFGQLGLASSQPALDGLLGLTYVELHGKWGQPRFIEVLDRTGDSASYYRVPATRWAEESGGPKVLGAQGQDVYIFNRLGVSVLYRLTWVGDFRADRFQPSWRIGSYQVKFGEPVLLAEVPALVPELAFLALPGTEYWLDEHFQLVEFSAFSPRGGLGDLACRVSDDADARVEVRLYPESPRVNPWDGPDDNRVFSLAGEVRPFAVDWATKVRSLSVFLDSPKGSGYDENSRRLPNPLLQ